MIQKITAVFLLFISFSLSLTAVPALRRYRTVQQENGDTLTLTKAGDEHHHFYLTRDNVPVVKSGRSFYYADRMGGRMQSSGILAHNKEQRSSTEKSHVSAMRRAAAAGSSATASDSSSAVSEIAKIRQSALRKASTTAYSGSRKGLIILVQFTDKTFSMSDAQATYTAIANEEGYQSLYSTTGSVHDYFYDQSYGQFALTFDIVGPIPLNKSYTYSGATDSSGNDIYPGRMAVDALNVIADEDLDFSQYDWDGDGEADQVFFLYAGQGEATSDDDDTIWPHEWTLSSALYYDYIYTLQWAQTTGTGRPGKPGGSKVNADSIYNALAAYYSVTIDGVSFDTYACSNERYEETYKGKTYTYLMGIGTICHEFSHCLGFPDLYDTEGSNYGMGYYDVMSAGNSNGPLGLGWVPAGYSSYERATAGWLTYQTLTDNRQYTLPALTDEPTAYIITNPGNENEYYLLENRQPASWDAYLPGSGMLAVHVDYDADVWSNNEVNTSGTTATSHQHLTILHADNDDAIRYYSNVIDSSEVYDPYPYVLNSVIQNDSITDASAPAATLYNANTDGTYYMHCRIMSITQQSDGTVTFLYNPSDETTAIDGVTTSDGVTVVARYNLSGVLLNEPQPGVNILKMSDGTTRKVIVK